MDKDTKIKVVGRIKAAQIIGCSNTAFYIKYYDDLLPVSFFGKDKRKRLYPLNDIMSIKEKINASHRNYEIVK